MSESSIDDIKKAIRQNSVALKNKGTIIPKTRLCQSVANVWGSILYESYKLQKEKNWDYNKRNDWVKEELLKMPLVLLEDKPSERYSNYYCAFKNPKYPVFYFIRFIILKE